jgi:serine/threonine protein phosphatase PrpC
MLEITIAARSERGRRKSNEDDLRCGGSGSLWYAVLADGAGGHEHGAEASRRAVSHLETALTTSPAEFTPENLTRLVHAAHAELQSRQQGTQGLQRMHTTVVVLWIDSRADRALWSHVGDSRLYRVRHGSVDVITRDDSVVQRMVDGGLIGQDEARTHPQKNQLLSALGVDDSVDPHTVPRAVPLDDGDAFLLCSDGWWETLSDADIANTLCDADTIEQWLDLMQRHIEARAMPKQDNFSAIAVWVGDVAQATRAMDDETVPPTRPGP